MIIRKALPAEYEVVGELTVSAFDQTLAFGQTDPYRTVLMDAAHRAVAADLLVAVEASGRIVGTVTSSPHGTDYADIARPGELEVRMLATAPDRGRTGVGRRLMAAVHQRGSAEHFDRVVLSVISTNAVAINFYRGLNYARVPSRDWEPVPNVILKVFARSVQTSN